jgi:Na+/H+ antiporter NhaD/arsenite permease-like protein
MNPATLSLIALVAVIVLSLTSRINIGVLAVALALPVGVGAAGWKPEAVLALFPSSLFLTLAGVTLLFGVAQTNGTLEALARRGVRACGGTPALLPPLFFLLAGAISALGPGALAATALVAPLALAAGASAGVPPFLMALMVANGGNAGNLSPFSAVGVIVHANMAKAGVPGHEGAVFLANFAAHVLVTGGAWLLFGGPASVRRPRLAETVVAPVALTGRQGFTLVVLGLWVAGVVGLGFNPGLSAFAAAAVLILARCGEDGPAVASVPWSVLLMVSGVSVLVGVLEKTGGLDLVSGLLAGLISTYSSTSGVVYPAFLPMVPGLVGQLGGGDPLQVALSINVGAALVDVSPLSTIGALCVAGLPPGGDSRRLFRQMLLWGFSMVPVSALLCQLGARWFS